MTRPSEVSANDLPDQIGSISPCSFGDIQESTNIRGFDRGAVLLGNKENTEETRPDDDVSGYDKVTSIESNQPVTRDAKAVRGAYKNSFVNFDEFPKKSYK